VWFQQEDAISIEPSPFFFRETRNSCWFEGSAYLGGSQLQLKRKQKKQEKTHQVDGRLVLHTYFRITL
jgi:hypothetical protein